MWMWLDWQFDWQHKDFLWSKFENIYTVASVRLAIDDEDLFLAEIEAIVSKAEREVDVLELRIKAITKRRLAGVMAISIEEIQKITSKLKKK